MSFFQKNIGTPFKILLALITGILIMAGTSIANESPNFNNKLIKYKNASVQTVTGTPTGLWHQTTIDGQSDVWYYGDNNTMTYDTGSTTSGILTMDFDLTNVSSANLILNTKYETENGTSYDKLQIKVGQNIVWERVNPKSLDADGNFGWESINIPLTKYIGSPITVSFVFDSMDGSLNNYFGWAINNVQVGSGSDPIITPTVGKLIINQLDTGNFPDINAYVTVTDANGNTVDGLTKQNFSVLENNSSVSNFTVSPLNIGGTQQPLSFGIMIDQSGSMGSGMSDAVQAVKDFINLSTGVQDQFGIVSIGSYASNAVNQVLVLKNFTTDKTELINAVTGLSAENMTPLYDGIAKTLELTAQQSGVKAVIAFTDGDDTQSNKYDVDSVINYAKTLGIPVYTIGVGYADKTVLTKIANQTGGIYTEAGSVSDLSSIYKKLLTVINQQYLIKFQSLNPSIGNTSNITSTGVTTQTPISPAPLPVTVTNQICVKIDAILPSTSVVSDISCYDKNNMSPNIVLDQQTSEYFQNGPTIGNDLIIGTIITDPNQDPIVDASLYYRTKGSSDTFIKVNMVLNSAIAGNYTATIPSSDYTSDGIEFYLTASDGILTKTVPLTSYFSIIPGNNGNTGNTGNIQQIYVLSPTKNATLDFGTSGGNVSFSWTKLTGVSKYILDFQLIDILKNITIPIPVNLDLGTTWDGKPKTPGLTENFMGITYTIPFDTVTWDILALYDVQWGIEAYDNSDNLIGSTFDLTGAPAKYVSKIKFLDSSAIVMTSPNIGASLSKFDLAPVFKWDTYNNVSIYTLVLAHINALGFDKVITKDGLTLNLFTMDDVTWQTMPTGTWYWTVIGFDSTGKQLPKKYNIFDFTVQ